jgi:hypothetical protein
VCVCVGGGVEGWLIGVEGEGRRLTAPCQAAAAPLPRIPLLPTSKPNRITVDPIQTHRCSAAAASLSSFSSPIIVCAPLFFMTDVSARIAATATAMSGERPRPSANSLTTAASLMPPRGSAG